MSKPLKVILSIFLTLAVVAGLGALAYTQFVLKPAGGPAAGGPGAAKGGPAAGGAAETEAVAAPVAVTKARLGPIRDTIELDGSIQSAREVSIFPDVPGKIKELTVREGSRVEAGQILAYIERDVAGLKYADAPVKSTIGGVVKKVLTERGGTVNPAAPLFQLVDMSAVEAIVHIPERQIPRVQTGLRAEIRLTAYPDRLFAGTVGALSPVLDPASRTREARIQVTNPGQTVKPGMSGAAQIVIRTVPSAVLIPYSALLEREERSLVFLAREGKAVEVEPALDIVRTDWVSVKSGVQPGDSVVVIGQHNLRPGDAVEVVEEIE